MFVVVDDQNGGPSNLGGMLVHGIDIGGWREPLQSGQERGPAVSSIYCSGRDAVPEPASDGIGR